DNVAVTVVDLLLSRTGAGGPFDSLAVAIANTGSFGWPVTGPATTNAFLEGVAHDAAGLTGTDLTDTAFTRTSKVGAPGGTPPPEFALGRIAPHPVLGAAHIRFDMPRSASIRLSVYDMQGREVAVLADGPWDSGTHQLDWRDQGASPGLYFVRLVVPGHT